MFRRSRWLLPLVALLILTGFWWPKDDTFFAIKKNFTIFGALYEELSTTYVDPVDPERFMRIGIDAMLRTLDPYTVFINEADNEDIDIMTRGRYGGVGLNVANYAGKITVVNPVEGYSGFKRGVRAGDVILSIDDRPVQGLTVSDITNLLRGDPGTVVTLRIEREGELEPIDFVLTRSEVKIKNVTYQDFIARDENGGIGYIRLERFAREAASEVQEAIRALEADGPLTGLVLDLRDNPGGLLDAAVDISGLFVPQGSAVVSTRGRMAESERVYRSRMPPLEPDLPVVVLINEYSASASEIVAGALQDLDRGVIVGERSFGKGLVQVVRPLPYNTSLKMTMSKYYTPSGRCIQAIDYTEDMEDGASIPDSLRNTYFTGGGRSVRDGGGIEPDLAVSMTEPSELESALLRTSAFFLYANSFASQHSSVGVDFEVTDDVLEDFKSWLIETKDFSFRTRAERMVNTLEDDLIDAGYNEALEQVASLRSEVQQEKERDFARHASTLKEHLRAEILARFHGETAQIAAALTRDPQLQASVQLLNDPATYNAILAVE